jgi:hypothetical protein
MEPLRFSHGAQSSALTASRAASRNPLKVILTKPFDIFLFFLRRRISLSDVGLEHDKVIITRLSQIGKGL